MEEPGLIDWMTKIAGGTFTTLVSAFVGRLMWHAGEVRRGSRRFFGWELVWEVPVAIGMAIIGEGLAHYFELVQPASTAVIAGLAYLGPRGVEALLSKWLARKA